MDSLSETDYLESLFSEDCDRYKTTEIINLPGFVINASSVIDREKNVTTFLVRKVYGWGSCQPDCCGCLFDYHEELAVGVWFNNILTIYQKKDGQYIRFIYFIENQKPKTYHNVVDILVMGKQWQRYSQGIYKWT